MQSLQPEQIKQAATKIIKESVKPLHNAELRRKLVELHKTTEQTIDTVSIDKVIEAGFSADALEKAKGLVTSFEQFIKDHKDEITALQILYSRPYKERLRFEEIKALGRPYRKASLSLAHRQALGSIRGIGEIKG